MAQISAPMDGPNIFRDQCQCRRHRHWSALKIYERQAHEPTMYIWHFYRFSRNPPITTITSHEGLWRGCRPVFPHRILVIESSWLSRFQIPVERSVRYVSDVCCKGFSAKNPPGKRSRFHADHFPLNEAISIRGWKIGKTPRWAFCGLITPANISVSLCLSHNSVW